MDCTIDVLADRVEGIPPEINDPSTYKMVLIDRGSLVVEEDGKNRVITAPVGIIANEKACLKVVSENNVRSLIVYFKPSVIREEFTIDSINSGKFDKFLTAVPDGEKMTCTEKIREAIRGDISFDQSFCTNMVFQDALLLMLFATNEKNVEYFSLSKQEVDTFKRLIGSIAYELRAQPDNFWILRTRYFLTAILFTATADFYRDCRQNEIYTDPLVAEVTAYFWSHLGEEIALETVLRKFSVNKNTLNDAFNKEVNMSCMTYLETLRINHARELLQHDDRSISEISAFIGYPDTNYFTKVFKKHTGMTPSEFRKHMKD